MHGIPFSREPRSKDLLLVPHERLSKKMCPHFNKWWLFLSVSKVPSRAPLVSRSSSCSLLEF